MFEHDSEYCRASMSPCPSLIQGHLAPIQDVLQSASVSAQRSIWHSLLSPPIQVVRSGQGVGRAPDMTVLGTFLMIDCHVTALFSSTKSLGKFIWQTRSFTLKISFLSWILNIKCILSRVGLLLNETKWHLVLFSWVLNETKCHLVLVLPN